ncbi:hypothetical protein PMIN03_011835 [Paraphaeosphaeria minitans]
MHCAAVLDYAAARPDGGPRSFPLAAEGRFLRDFAYDPPTKAYEQLLSRQIAVLDPSQSSRTSCHSAGWLIPDEASPRKPVQIAPSLLSAISLIRQMLPPSTLPDGAWKRLVAAAQHLTADPDHLDAEVEDEDPSSVPPSTQKPSSKRKLLPWLSAASQPAKRACARAPSRPASPDLSLPSSQGSACVSGAQPPAPSPVQLSEPRDAPPKPRSRPNT